MSQINQISFVDSTLYASDFITDNGTATVVGNEIEILGGTNITTDGAGNIVNVNLNDAIFWPDTNDSFTEGAIHIGDEVFLHNLNENTALGNDALLNVTTGTNNVGIGENALINLTTGERNVAIGSPGTGITSGSNNIGIGHGVFGFTSVTGSFNIAIGDTSLLDIQDGEFNVAIKGLNRLVSGDNNIAIGSRFRAGYNYTGSESNNVVICNNGVTGESNKIRIGTDGTGNAQQDEAFIAGLVHGARGFEADTGDVTLNSGRINLPATNSAFTEGSVVIDSAVFMHSLNGNTALGDNSLSSITTGINNIGIGDFSSQNLTEGSRNTSLGSGALSGALTASNNTALGRHALQEADSDNNVAVGYWSGKNITTGVNNTSIGTISLNNVTTGTDNIAIGKNAGEQLNSSDSSNIVIGNRGVNGDSNKIRIGTDGISFAQQDEAFIAGLVHGARGFEADSGNVTLQATNNNGSTGVINIGNTHLHDASTNQVFLGSTAGSNFSNISGTSNTGIGNSALREVTSGSRNTALGSACIQQLTTGSDNTAAGRLALVNCNGSGNSAFGRGSLGDVTTGGFNTAVGNLSGPSITTGDNNTFVGDGVAPFLIDGSNNIFAGRSAGSSYTSNESNNILIDNSGTVGESNKIRIGTYGTQDTSYIAGLVHSESGFEADSGNVTLLATNAGATDGAINIGNSHIHMTDDGEVYIGFGTGVVGSGEYNVGIGRDTLSSLTTGDRNVVAGHSGSSLTSGERNCLIGHAVSNNLTTGSHNTLLGDTAGVNYSSNESYNVLLKNTGVAGESNVMRLGRSGQQNATYVVGTYGRDVNSNPQQMIMSDDDKQGTMPNSQFLVGISSELNDVTGGGGTPYDVPFDVAVYDDNSDFNTTTGIFTAPVDGLYHFEASLGLNDVNADATLLITRITTPNLTMVDRYNPSGLGESTNNYIITGGSISIELTTGDTVGASVFVAGQSSNNVDIRAGRNVGTWFSGYLVRPT